MFGIFCRFMGPSPVWIRKNSDYFKFQYKYNKKRKQLKKKYFLLLKFKTFYEPIILFKI